MACNGLTEPERSLKNTNSFMTTVCNNYSSLWCYTQSAKPRRNTGKCLPTAGGSKLDHHCSSFPVWAHQNIPKTGSVRFFALTFPDAHSGSERVERCRSPTFHTRNDRCPACNNCATGADASAVHNRVIHATVPPCIQCCKLHVSCCHHQRSVQHSAGTAQSCASKGHKRCDLLRPV